MDLKFKTPFTCIVAGSINSGKSTFIQRVLYDSVRQLDRPPTKVFYFYNIYQQVFNQLKTDNIVNEFIEGMPTVQWFKDNCIPFSLVVIDDQGMNVNPELVEIFQVCARHLKTSLFFVTQNLFSKNKHYRDISLNAMYIVVFRNVRDASSIVHLAKQITPGNPRMLQEIYQRATYNKPFSYLVIDLHQLTNEDFRFRSDIFAMYPTIWIAKENLKVSKVKTM